MRRAPLSFFDVFGPRKVKSAPYAVSPARRARVIERDGSDCAYCRRALVDTQITIDHVMPKKLGGSNDDGNLVVACRPCNSSKGHRSAPASHVVNR